MWRYRTCTHPVATFRILAPVGNETPPQRVERYLASLMIAPDHKEVIAWRGIPPGWIIVNAAIAHVDAIDDAIAYRTAALDDPPDMRLKWRLVECQTTADGRARRIGCDAHACMAEH
jgi:hypothetical protein